MTEFRDLPTIPRTDLYGERFLELGLLLSIHHYGWRAHRDLAAFLLGDRPLDGISDDHEVHLAEHRAMAALEELFLLLDQIWRVIGGIQSHRRGGGFLAGYRKHGDDVKTEFDRLQELTEDEWRLLFSLPTPDELPKVLFERSVTDPNDLRNAREMVDDQINTARENVKEVSSLFDRVNIPAGFQTRSVRDINNAYRHGTLIVYEDCSPQEIQLQAANPEEGVGLLLGIDEVQANSREETVTVLLEGPDEEGHARLASQPRGQEWADDLVRSMQNLSVLLYRLVVSFLISEATGGPVVGSLLLDWKRLQAEER
jgi:hypothetical protein